MITSFILMVLACAFVVSLVSGLIEYVTWRDWDWMLFGAELVYYSIGFAAIGIMVPWVVTGQFPLGGAS